ncbi:MAG: S8 family peptidase [Gammaproteobacteria bacterium]
MINITKQLPFLVVIASLITACGGGGGGGANVVTQPPPPPQERTEAEIRQEYAAHREFRNQSALTVVKAHYAYARGATGAGITVGIVDSGVDPNHPEFRGKLRSTEFVGSPAPNYAVCSARAQDGTCTNPDDFHGTFVAGVIAANRDTGTTDSIHGIAFDAALRSVGIPLDDAPPFYTPISLPDATITQGSEEIAGIVGGLNSQVTAINLSIGFQGNIEDYTEAAIRAAFSRVIETIAQAGTEAADRTVYVWAAGNANGSRDQNFALVDATSPEIISGLPVRVSELRGHSLAVVAVDESQGGTIADFSNRCGIAKEFCLAAPGVAITGPTPNIYCRPGSGDCYTTAAGTSFAAPLVTGSVALLAQHYRGQLGNSEIAARLLATANKNGIYANSDIYGQGLLDLDAATRPLGTTRILTGGSLAGPFALEGLSSLSLGSAFGDAVRQGLAGREIAAFDTLDTPFFRSFDDYIRPASTAMRLEDRLWAMGNDLRGPLWSSGGLELRARFDRRASPRSGLLSLAHQGDSPATEFGDQPRWHLNHIETGHRLGSLSLTQQLGDNDVFIGYRSHPGWRFGLHAALTDSAAPVIAPGTFTDETAFTNPFLALARDGSVAGVSMPVGRGALSVAAFHGAAQYGERRVADDSRATGTLAEYRVTDNESSGLAVQAGWLMEPQRLAGSRPDGAFGALGSSTSFMGISAHHRAADRWTLFASAHAGMSQVQMQNQGVLQDVSALWSSTLGIGIVGEEIINTEDRLALRFSQPLRVESGDARLRWTSGRTRDRQVQIEQAALDLTPSGRQLDLELTYSRPWKGGLAWLAMLASHQPGHTRGKHDFALLMRYSSDF